MHSDNRNGCDSAQEVKFINVWTCLLPLPADNLLVVLCDHFTASRCPTLPGASPTEERASLACRSRCSTLPRAFFGSDSTAMNSMGTLCALSRLAAYSCNAFANSGVIGPFTTT